MLRLRLIDYESSSSDSLVSKLSYGSSRVGESLLEYDPTRLLTIETYFHFVAKTLLRLRFESGIALKADRAEPCVSTLRLNDDHQAEIRAAEDPSTRVKLLAAPSHLV